MNDRSGGMPAPPPAFSDIAAAIQRAERILIFSHIRPDGDAIGSLLALGLALRDSGKSSTAMWSEDGVPEALSFMDGAGLIRRPPASPERFDLVVAVDTAARKRAGDKTLEALAPGALLINIDHHGSNDAYGDINHVDPASPATGQILFEFLSYAGLPISPATAAALFVAISTDTGFFQYPGTSARTHEIIARLIRAGADAPAIAARLNDNSPRRRFELMRVFLDHARFEHDGRIASSTLSMADTASAGAKPEDTEGLIDLIRGVEGVIVAVFLEEMEHAKVRVSMRSKSRAVDASAICAGFGGGGHPAAAGARVAGKLDEVRSLVVEAVKNAIP